jgi:RNA polymerase sigma-70 factor, ECF subfamily
VASHYRGDHPALDLAEVVVAVGGRTVLDEVIHRDKMRRVQAAIDRLRPAQRLAMRLRFTEDRSCAGVGRILGKSDAAVKLLVYRALRRLRRDLANLV